MSWVCSHGWWDGWLHPAANQCLIPWERVGKSEWEQQGEVGQLVPHRCAAFELCLWSSAALLVHGKSLLAKEIGHCFGSKHPASTPFQK